MTRSCGGVRAAIVLVLAVSTAHCTSVPYATSSGPPSSRREERLTIESYATVTGVALSQRLTFAATRGGVAVYDRVFARWLPPLAGEVGLPDGPVSVIAADPIDDAVWVGVPGGVVSYQPATERVQRTIVAGIPDLIAFDRNTSDALVRANGNWTRVSRVGSAIPVAPPNAASLVVPANLNEVYRRFPALRAGTSFLVREQQLGRPLRSYPIVSGSVTPDRASEVWLGTAGDGLYRVDPTFQQATPLRFGPLETALGAVASTGDGVWMGGLGDVQSRGGISYASADLQRWRWIEGTIAAPLAGMRVFAMSIRGSRAWLGTDRGVVRVALDDESEIRIWSSLDGLPDDRVYSVAARDNGAWVGTARGLVFVADTLGRPARDARTRGIAAQLLDNVAVLALQPIGDTLWIGTASGLYALPGASAVAAGGAASIARPLGGELALRRETRALGWSDTMLVAATEDAVVRLTPRGGSEPTRIDALDPRIVGSSHRIAIDAQTIVLVGTDGVIVYPRGGGTPITLRPGPDLPAPALDVALTRDWLWFATPAGLVRWRRASDGGLR